MKIVSTYSPGADTAYVAFGDSRDVAETVAPVEDLAIDLDRDGRVVGIEFVTASRLLDESALEDAELDELVGVTEIASYLGKRKQNVAQHYASRDDFPEPAAELPTGRYWRRGDVEAWATRFKREEGRFRAAAKRAAAAEWLSAYLAEGPRRVDELREGATAEGVSWTTVCRAAAALGIEKHRVGRRTEWELPTRHARRREGSPRT
jgi:uncharacterized protein YuzE